MHEAIIAAVIVIVFALFGFVVINHKLDKIMVTQAKIANDLRNAVTTLNKIGDETDKLIKKVADLTAAVANQENASPELEAAAKAIEDQMKAVDDKVPDSQSVPPAPTGTMTQVQ